MANAHLDSPIGDIEERKRESEVCGKFLLDPSLGEDATLSTSTLTVLCGDLNLFTTSELIDNTPLSFLDSITSTKLDPAVESAESATLGLTFALPEYPPRRSDFVLWKGDGWQCSTHVNFGSEPVRDSTGAPLPCDRGELGYLYPSDHLGVMTKFLRE